MLRSKQPNPTGSYGGHARDAQITQWAGMAPGAAIAQILTFGKTNALLSPSEDASAQHAGGLLTLQNLWGGEAADNPMRADKREDYHPLYFNSNGDSSVSYNNLERAWTQAVATRGLNPFLHKMAFILSNYQMSISEFKTRSALIRDYYDTLLDALSTQTSFIDVINAGANAGEKLDVLSPIAANHAESLANLPLFIINLFADDNLTPDKEKAIQAQWRESNFNLLAFLRLYATSTIFHSSDTFKYLTSFDRSLMLFNLITLDNNETFLGLNNYENAED